MALFLTVVVVLTCFGGLASPNPVPSSSSLKELIEELVNITQNQKVSACGPSSEGAGYCAALDSLISISNCSVIHRTKRMLSALCPHKPSAKVRPP
ncbi:hypothetical protein MG293_008593, partial [Ovis ammon polii]